MNPSPGRIWAMKFSKFNDETVLDHLFDVDETAGAAVTSSNNRACCRDLRCRGG